ncbi:MAG: lytic transglycosylase domain-containing protein [Candidatus Omnitrophica bacterium]|nr:lytic transglycosylase domain-containing protein [Candidatus Omnitrophota bacterium]
MIIKHGKKQLILLLCIVLAVILALTFVTKAYADNLKEIIEKASRNYQVSLELIYQVIEVESSFNPYAVSIADARGLMQITRPTWDWICRDFLQVSWSFEEDSFNREKNIIVGTRFLAWINNYLNKHANELNANHNDLVLACYNAGPGTVKRYGFRVPPFKETQNYIARISSGF